jgi:hypothetical protein
MHKFSNIRDKDFAVSFYDDTVILFDSFPDYAKAYIAECLNEAKQIIQSKRFYANFFAPLSRLFHLPFWTWRGKR